MFEDTQTLKTDASETLQEPSESGSRRRGGAGAKSAVAGVALQEAPVQEAPQVLPQPDALLRNTPADPAAETPTKPDGLKRPAAAAPPAPPAQGQAPVRKSRRKLVFAALLAIAAVAGAVYGHYWWTTGRFIEETDDAYVGADTATIAAKVAGYVSAVQVKDNEQVRAGQVIARIDDGDYQLAAQSAADQVATQMATVMRIETQIAAQQASVDQATTQVASAKAAETRTALELKRQQALAANKYASQQTLEQAQAAHEQAVAAVDGAEAGVTVAKTNIGVLQAQEKEAESTLAQMKTALAKAERDLSFTVIKAPFDGVIGNRAIKLGDYVQPAQRLLSLVPLNHVYIDANFKETQLEGIKPGQAVSISVDALPDQTITGEVVSIAPASGSVFSLLPPDNATGNFTKIVQRVPVRIGVPVSVADRDLLRPGMSVVVSINTKQAGAGKSSAATPAAPASPISPIAQAAPRSAVLP
jgi:membrane fusion protein, multidrug efflux system